MGQRVCGMPPNTQHKYAQKVVGLKEIENTACTLKSLTEKRRMVRRPDQIPGRRRQINRGRLDYVRCSNKDEVAIYRKRK